MGGDNDEARAELMQEILANKLIHYTGSLAAVFMEDSEDIAGQSGDWTLAHGESVNNSFACVDGGGYGSTTTRTDWTTLSVSLILIPDLVS